MPMLWFAWKYLPLWYQQQHRILEPFVSPWLWFAWKYLPLWYQQQLVRCRLQWQRVVICLKISTFVVSTTTILSGTNGTIGLWFAWKYLPLWYQQQLGRNREIPLYRCDLLENIYLCGINNNLFSVILNASAIVICLKISTFVVSTTTNYRSISVLAILWFAWKYLPLWYQQQP